MVWTITIAGVRSLFSSGKARFASIVTTLSNLSGSTLDVLAFLLVTKITQNQIWQTKTVEVF